MKISEGFIEIDSRYSHYFKSKKDLTYWRIYLSALELETQKSPLKWSLSELASKSKIHRSLIYHYLGKSKLEIVKASVLGVGNVIFGLDPSFPQLWEQGKKSESLSYAIEILSRYPFLKKFYVQERREGSLYFAEIKSLEEQFFKKMKVLNGEIAESEIANSIAALIGLLFFSEDEQSIVDGLKLLKI